MGKMIFGRTQQSVQTPFEPGRVTALWPTGAPFVSIEAQSAIEEALNLAIGNDRYLILGEYGGNANVGRYLEWWPGTGSDSAPIFNTNTSRILAVVLQTTASAATCNVGIFDLTVSDTVPVYTIVMTAQKRVTYAGTASVPLASVGAGSLLAVRVTSGSINTPTLQLIFSLAV